MNFEIERVNLEDLENRKYPIFDIAIPGWNPKNHYDDPYAINDLEEDYQTNIMNVTDSIPNNIKGEKDIQIPWDISSAYDNDKGKTIMNLMGINASLNSEKLHDTERPKPSQQDLSVQHKAFQIRKHQIEVLNFNSLAEPDRNLSISQTDDHIDEEEFYDCKEFIDDNT